MVALGAGLISHPTYKPGVELKIDCVMAICADTLTGRPGLDHVVVQLSAKTGENYLEQFRAAGITR